MQARRAVVLAALTALVVVVPGGVAHAAGTGQITSPSAGATVTSDTPLVVEVTGRAGTLIERRDHTVELRLADLGGAERWGDTEVVAASCESNCHEDSTWTAGDLDPATLAPFGSAPSCNGAYAVQTRVDDGAWTGHGIRIARDPHAPPGVAVTPGVRTAEVTWDAAPDPDVVGYRVERRGGDGSWTRIGQVPPSARALTDDDVAAGDVAYRVVTLKGDGMVNGAPASPCTDPDPDLATPSAAVPTTVRSSATASGSDDQASPTPDPSEPDGGDAGTDRTGDGDTSGDGTTTGDGTSGDGDQAGTAGARTEGGSSGDRPTAGSRVAPPTAVGTRSRPDVGVAAPDRADAPQVAEDQESYYGDGMEFSEELDFGDLGEVDALGDTMGEQRVRVPGGLQSVLGEELELERVLTPLAAGLILLASALHLRRWTREGADV